MLYRYNKNTLEFTPVNRAKLIGSVVTTLGVFLFSTGVTVPTVTNQRVSITVEDTIYVQGFSEENLIKYLKELNVKYPHIVLAQAQLESGYYKSKIFKESRNLFGMKRAYGRATTAQGTSRGHAYYDHWTQSVIDYALWSNKYLGRVRSEEQYFAFLGEHYAEDPAYIAKLKKRIKDGKLYEKVEYTF